MLPLFIDLTLDRASLLNPIKLSAMHQPLDDARVGDQHRKKQRQVLLIHFGWMLENNNSFTVGSGCVFGIFLKNPVFWIGRLLPSQRGVSNQVTFDGKKHIMTRKACSTW